MGKDFNYGNAEDLKKVKEHYNDIFPSDVNDVLDDLIDEEIDKQEKEICIYKKSGFNSLKEQLSLSFSY